MKWVLRGDKVGHVLRRELIDSLRDFDTITTTFGLPIFTWFIAALMVVFSMEQVGVGILSDDSKIEHTEIIEDIKEQKEKYRVAVIGEIPAKAKEVIEAHRDYKLYSAAFAYESKEDEKTIEQGIIDDEYALVVISHEKEPAYSAEEKNYDITMLSSGLNKKSREARDGLREILLDIRNDWRNDRLKELDLNYDQLSPMRIHTKRIDSMSRLVYDLAGKLFPLMLISFAAASAYAPAVASIAGEKESKTLATIVCAPLKSSEIIIGKFLNVVMFALMGAATYLLPLYLLTGVGYTFFPQIGLSLWPLILAFLCLIPGSMIYSALAICVAGCGGSYKLSQALMLPFMFLFLLPASVSMIPDLEFTWELALIPLASLSLLIQSIINDTANFQTTSLALFSNFSYAGLALLLAVRIVRLQGGGFAEQMSFKEALTQKAARPTNTQLLQPNIRFSLALFLLLLPVSLLSQLVMTQMPLWMIISSLMFIIVGLPVLSGIWLKIPFAELVMYRMPGWQSWLGALFVGLGCWAASLTLSWIIPLPKGFSEILSESLSLGVNQYPIGVLILFLAVLPGLCEEITFRGYIMRGMLNTRGPAVAIFLSAVFFGMMHFSLYRFLPTFGMGLILGFIAWRTRSLWLSILIHIINNALVVFVSQLPQEMFDADKLALSDILPYWLVGWGLLIGGLFLIWKYEKPLA